jgi:hypothetical protein
LALALLVFALEKLKLSEPLKNGISEFRSTGFILVLNDGNVCIDGFEICLLALLSVDCRVEVFANGLPGTGAIRVRIQQEIGTCEIGRSAPRPRLTF